MYLLVRNVPSGIAGGIYRNRIIETSNPDILCEKMQPQHDGEWWTIHPSYDATVTFFNSISLLFESYDSVVQQNPTVGRILSKEHFDKLLWKRENLRGFRPHLPRYFVTWSSMDIYYVQWSPNMKDMKYIYPDINQLNDVEQHILFVMRELRNCIGSYIPFAKINDVTKRVEQLIVKNEDFQAIPINIGQMNDIRYFTIELRSDTYFLTKVPILYP